MYKAKSLNDDEIKGRIIQTLEGTDFTLVSFERNHEFFGNMIAVIKSSKKKYTFITDRDDIFCNKKLIKPHGYHVVGEDETPAYLIKAIKDKINSGLCCKIFTHK